MRKQYFFLTALLWVVLAINAEAQIVVSEIISPNLIELQNQGTDTVDVDQYWLCNRPEYDRIGSLSPECGNFNMAPGSFIVVTTNLTMPREGGEMGIYLSGDFGDTSSIVDYVIWGERGTPSREEVEPRQIFCMMAATIRSFQS